MWGCLQVVFYLKEMAPEEADEKYANVMRQRNMFIYKKECARSDPCPLTSRLMQGPCVQHHVSVHHAL